MDDQAAVPETDWDPPFEDAPESAQELASWGPPPTFQELDHMQYHIALKDVGERLQNAANAAFPNNNRMRYSSVYVLMLCWDDEDPNLPVSIEVDELKEVFRRVYHYNVEVWRIPTEGSHKKLNRKVLDFIELGEDSKDDLKIVYYGGHGLLAKNRQPCWASRPSVKDTSYASVKWSGIQNALEEAHSDVLLLLDCCASGTANTDDGQGVTELIAACSFNGTANPVGPNSFTSALIAELRMLSNAPSFTAGVLYNKVLCRIQSRMPVGREMQKSPLHVVLSQNQRLPRAIQLSPIRHPKPIKTTGFTHEQVAEWQNHCEIPQIPQPSRPDTTRTSSSYTDTTIESSDSGQPSASSSIESLISDEVQFPRIAISIRLQETLDSSELSVDLLSQWLQMMPILAENVRVEAGFTSFSTLLVLSMPVAIWCYISFHPALTTIGIVKSPNLISKPRDPDLAQITEDVTKKVKAQVMKELRENNNSSITRSPNILPILEEESDPEPNNISLLYGDDTNASRDAASPIFALFPPDVSPGGHRSLSPRSPIEQPPQQGHTRSKTAEMRQLSDLKSSNDSMYLYRSRSLKKPPSRSRSTRSTGSWDSGYGEYGDYGDNSRETSPSRRLSVAGDFPSANSTIRSLQQALSTANEELESERTTRLGYEILIEEKDDEIENLKLRIDPVRANLWMAADYLDNYNGRVDKARIIGYLRSLKNTLDNKSKDLLPLEAWMTAIDDLFSSSLEHCIPDGDSVTFVGSEINSSQSYEQSDACSSSFVEKPLSGESPLLSHLSERTKVRSEEHERLRDALSLEEPTPKAARRPQPQPNIRRGQTLGVETGITFQNPPSLVRGGTGVVSRSGKTFARSKSYDLTSSGRMKNKNPESDELVFTDMGTIMQENENANLWDALKDGYTSASDVSELFSSRKGKSSDDM